MTCLSDAPDAPKKPLAVLRYSATALPSITLSWKAGTANGSPISNYQICFQRTTKSTSPFQSVSPTGAATATGLIGGGSTGTTGCGK